MAQNYFIYYNTIIINRCNLIDKEYCFSLMKPTPQRIQAIIKARQSAAKY